MEYKFLENINTEDVTLPQSSKINSYLLKNNYSDAVKALDFFATEGTLLYIHGFLGTGKRQFINYISDFLDKDIIKLEYHCKASTVCDDILLLFIELIEKNALSKVVNHTAKITTLTMKFKQYVSSIKKPFVIILHSYDDIAEENRKIVAECMSSVTEFDNVKIIVSTRAMITDVLGDINVDKKIFLKPLSKELFKEYVTSYGINGDEEALMNFYKCTRGYYYYTALSIKIMQAMNISLEDFLTKLSLSEMSFDSFLGLTYLNLIPNTIRNFFWFLCSIRHGISLNALAILELYDDFSIGYLKNNLMIFQSNEVIYVQDYFQQDIDISIPKKMEIKLHKYIIGIYEKELKQSLQSRAILISRQALRAEIEYHNKRIAELENDNSPEAKIEHEQKDEQQTKVEQAEEPISEERININNLLLSARKLADEKKNTEAIDAYMNIMEEYNADPYTLAEIRVALGGIYQNIGEFPKAQHYYELAEKFYKQNNENINLSYLYYDLAGLYNNMYKTERSIETIKKVIYSVDTPQSLLVDSCILLGNIYDSENKQSDAYRYYKKALESVDENISDKTTAELYFKLALACDEQEDEKQAYEYYNLCISKDSEGIYKALAYSNLGACYYENGNLSDAEGCFLNAYKIEKEKNNYDGIYYTSSYLAKIYVENKSDKALDFLVEAKQSAEFINEEFAILQSEIALGDYYYDKKDMNSKALIEYLKAYKLVKNLDDSANMRKIEDRIEDMKLRMSKEEFENTEKRYG